MHPLIAQTLPLYPSPSPEPISASAGLWFAGIFVVIWLFILAVSLVFLVWNIILIIDASRRTNWGNNQGDPKTLWMVLLVTGLVFGFGWIICIVYYFVILKPLGKATMAPIAPFEPTVTESAGTTVDESKDSPKK